MHPNPDVLALLALGEQAGTAAEREHVAGCADCRAELESLARAVDIGRNTVAGDTLLIPHDRVWEAIRTELNFGQVQGSHGLTEVATITAIPRHARDEGPAVPAEPVEPVEPVEPAEPVAPAADGARRGGRRNRMVSLALAAALALVVGIGLGVGLDRLLPLQTVLWTAELQARPDWAGAQGEATVVQDRRGNKTLVIKMTSTRPVDGDRQVWVADKDLKGMRPVGFLNADSDRLPLPRDFSYEEFPVVDVSKEPADDTEPRHSGISIVRGTLAV
jgi:hypothetical protein